MKQKSTKCPRCETIIAVTNVVSKDNPIVICPTCRARLRVHPDTGETQFAEGKSDQKVIGSLICKGEIYRLSEGVNTIGRKSSNSTATLQIATDDKSMSKVHAEIKVIKLESGRYKAVLRDIRADWKMKEKPMYFTDVKIYPEDQLNLENGDTFKMGDTLVKYVQKSS